MKHLDPITADLVRLCTESELRIPIPTLARLVKYLNAVLAANESVNLTRITDPAQALRLHLLDSLCAVPEILLAPAGSICDIGTGGGFPGVPIALACDRDAMLLDSVRKKSDVVERILTELGMNSMVAVSHDRAEQHAREHASRYAAVTARAVAPLASLVELASPLLRPGGVLIALKGNPDEAEFASGLAAARVVGLTLKTRRDFVLAGGNELRCVIAYEKTGASTVRLPRREGLAQHVPLG